jgi:glutamate 5-kinase
LKVDDGAQRALRDRGKSLLPPGIRDCTGAFLPGDVVRICDLEGVEFARGIVRYPAAEVSSGHLARTEVVHRDDLVIL